MVARWLAGHCAVLGSWPPTLGGRRPVAQAHRPPEPTHYLIGDGEDELHALTEPALKLDAIRRAGRLVTIEERARLAFIEGAEEESRRTYRRGLSAYELEAVLARYPTTDS